MEAYSEKVMDHFANPRNVGEISDADGVGTAGNPVCGDVMKLYLKVNNDVIEDVKFQTFGCGAAIATSSMLTELVKGKAIEEALRISNKVVAEALDGLPPVKMHCSVLAEDALKAALNDYFDRAGRTDKPAGVAQAAEKLKRREEHGHEEEQEGQGQEHSQEASAGGPEPSEGG